MQYVQKLLQPNMMFTKADCPGARRARSPSTIERSSSSVTHSRSPASARRIISGRRCSTCVPNTRLTNGNRSNSRTATSRCCIMQPQTAITASGRSSLISRVKPTLPNTRRSAWSRTQQVLNTITSASCIDAARRIPSDSSSPAMVSLSRTFI